MHRRWLGLGVFICLLVGGLHAQQPAAQPKVSETTSVNDTAPPAHPATDDQIREYFALTGLAKTTHELMATMVTAMRASSVPYLTPAFWDDVNAEFLKLDVVKMYVPIYQRYLSEEDMKGVIAFYRSGAGKRLLNVQAVVTSEAKVLMAQKGKEIGEAAYARHKDEIDAAKAKYDAKPLALPPH